MIETWCKDEWSGFANLLADLIEKYAAVLDVDNLLEPSYNLDSDDSESKTSSKLFLDTVETTDAA